MSDISTTYMGLKLNSPVIVGACSLSKRIEKIKAAEEAGAGAIVIKSLFEEQLQIESARLAEEISAYQDMIAESLTFHPKFEHGGAKEHLMWLEKTKKETSIPIIASVNAVSPGEWTRFAVSLESSGVDALELNFYGVVTDPRVTEQHVIAAMLDTLADIKSKVKIPVAVKLSPYFASPANVMKLLDNKGADGIVIFNRFAQPGINVKDERLFVDMSMSVKDEQGHPLRWTGLMYGKLEASLCASTGIHDPDDAIKMLLAGADAVQIVSALYLHGINHIQAINDGISAWMTRKGYETIDQFKGKVSRTRTSDPYMFERSQYIKALLGFD